MPFDLARIKRELEGALIVSPYPPQLSAAVISDTFRLARVVPPPAAEWESLLPKSLPKKPNLREEQLGMLAHALLNTSLREESVAALSGKSGKPEDWLEAFLEHIQPLTAEMIRSNAFRQEEFLRRWIECIGGEIDGETAKQSKARLQQLDYNTTIREFNKADAARKQEAARRAKLLQEARDREAAARGWRE